VLFSGDIISKRGEIEPQITPPPVEITIGVAVPLVEVRTSGVISYNTIKNAVSMLGLPYEVYMSGSQEIGFVYYLISSELNINEDSLNWVLPEEVYINEVQKVKPIARYVYDYLVSRGVNFVLAVCLYKGTWTSQNVYTILKVPFLMDSPDSKEFLKRDIDFVLAIFPTPKNSYEAGDLHYTLITTILNHVDVCSSKQINALDENSQLLGRIGQLERFFILGLPPTMETVIRNTYQTAGYLENALQRTVFLTSNFTEAYLPTIFGGEAEESLSGGSGAYDFTWSLIGLPFIMAYVNGNLARPLTGKPIGEITFGGTKVGMSVLSKLYTLYGACLLIADNPNETPTCYRSNTMAYGIGDYDESRMYGIEDTEFSLMFVEDTMDKINRAFLRAFRGNILNKTMVKVIEERFKRFVLDDYLSKGWILAYRNVKFKQDENDPTKVVGSYAYMPAYPINKIWVEHFFIL
jgi:hypothetical protein